MDWLTVILIVSFLVLFALGFAGPRGGFKTATKGVLGLAAFIVIVSAFVLLGPHWLVEWLFGSGVH